jgi:hypothetical protein
MTLNPSSRLSRAALASLLALAVQGAWAQATISSASAHIGNLTYRLVDLAPDDGITPGIVFGPNPSNPLATSITGYFGYFPVNGTPDGYEIYGNAPFQPTHPDSTSRALWGSEYGGATATYEVDRFGMDQKLATSYMTKRELTGGAVQWVSPNEGLLPTGYREWFMAFTQFQLTANTELIIEGDLTQSLLVNPLAFTNDPELSAALTGLRGHSEISFNVSGADTPYQNKVDLDYVIDDLGGLTTSSVLGTSASKAWSIKVSNASGSTLESSLNFRFEATTSAVGVVPEPSTWAMLLAGVGLTGLFARRRRAA